MEVRTSSMMRSWEALIHMGSLNSHKVGWLTIRANDFFQNMDYFADKSMHSFRSYEAPANVEASEQEVPPLPLRGKSRVALASIIVPMLF